MIKINKVTEIIAFGNSYSDNGEARRISSEIVQNELYSNEAFIKPTEGLYWNNRYSNGYTSVEILAQKLGAKLTNYATGGATSGKENYTAWMDYVKFSGLLGQIDKFEENIHLTSSNSNPLYFIFACENDYFKHMDFKNSISIKELANNVIYNINMAVKRLVTLGAKNFFIVNCSDLTLVPYEISMNRLDFAKEFVELINENIPVSLENLEKELEISINIFNHTIVSNDIKNNPNKYFFTELKKEYQSTYPEILTASDNPDNYYFWDEWHFSAATHKIFGESMFNKVLDSKYKS